MSTANDASDMVSPPVLIVEDDPTFGKALCALLARAGVPTDWRRDGVGLMAALKGTCYRALLLDLGLPGMSGFEVLRHARSADPDLPIVIVTASADVRERIRGLDLGADDYLVKPFEPIELFARLRAVTRRRAGQLRTPLDGSLSEVSSSDRCSAIELAAAEELDAGLMLALLAGAELEDLAVVLLARDTLH